MATALRRDPDGKGSGDSAVAEGASGGSAVAEEAINYGRTRGYQRGIE